EGARRCRPGGRGSLQRRASLVPDDGNMAVPAPRRKCRAAMASIAGGGGAGVSFLSCPRKRASTAGHGAPAWGSPFAGMTNERGPLRSEDAASVEQRQRDQDLHHGGRDADREAVAERRAQRRRRHGGGACSRQGAGGGRDLS